MKMQTKIYQLLYTFSASEVISAPLKSSDMLALYKWEYYYYYYYYYY